MKSRVLLKCVVFYFLSLYIMKFDIGYSLALLSILISMVYLMHVQGYIKYPLIFMVGIVIGALVGSYITYEIRRIDTFHDVEMVGYIEQNSPMNDKYTFYSKYKIENGTFIRCRKKYVVYIKSNYDDIGFKRVRLKGKVDLGERRRNPNDFDKRIYLRSRGYAGTIYTSTTNIDDYKRDFNTNLLGLRFGIKNKLYEVLRKHMDSDSLGLVMGLTIADKSMLNEDTMEGFRKSGTAHILAVSGLHIGILFLSVSTLLKALRIHRMYKEAIPIIVIWLFAILIDMSPSVLRASSMLSMYTIAPWLNRRYDSLSAVAFIALISTCINPFIVYNIGFQLSIIAVVSIVLLNKPIARFKIFQLIPKPIRDILTISIAAQLGTMPIMAFAFNGISLLGLVFNIPTILLISVLLPLLLVLLVLALLLPSLIPINIIIVTPLIKLLVYINTMSGDNILANIYIRSPYIAEIIIYYLVLMLIFAPSSLHIRKYYKRIGILIMILLAIHGFTWYIDNRYIRYTYFDVGQGDGSMIRTPLNKTTIMIDGGDKLDDSMLKLLLKNRVTRIDLMVLSHNHSDHINGLIEIAKHIEIGSLMIPTTKYDSAELKALIEICNDKNVNIIRGYKGLNFELGRDIDISVLHPRKNVTSACDDPNNNSLVMIVDYKGIKALYTGDIEDKAEGLLARYAKRDIDILKIPHHGSNTSSSEAFLNHYMPDIGVIQVGRKNKFDHPNEEVLDRLDKESIKYYRNDLDGAIIIKYNNHRLTVERQINLNY